MTTTQSILKKCYSLKFSYIGNTLGGKGPYISEPLSFLQDMWKVEVTEKHTMCLFLLNVEKETGGGWSVLICPPHTHHTHTQLHRCRGKMRTDVPKLSGGCAVRWS